MLKIWNIICRIELAEKVKQSKIFLIAKSGLQRELETSIYSNRAVRYIYIVIEKSHKL